MSVVADDARAPCAGCVNWYEFMSISHIVVGVVLALACISDLRTRRIPNVLTFSAVATALLFHLLTGGWSAAGWSIAGCFLGALLFFPMFALRGMGAGDVKLLAAVGAWLGPSQVAIAALATSIAGGVIALAVALGHGYLKDGVPQSVDAADALAGHGPSPGARAHTPGCARPAPRVRVPDRHWHAGDVMAQVGRWLRRWRSEDGAQLVEFALVLPLLLLVMLGIAEFGFMFQRYEVVTNAAREGARLAVLPGYTDADVQARVASYTVQRPRAHNDQSGQSDRSRRERVDSGVGTAGRRSARSASRSPTPTPFSF